MSRSGDGAPRPRQSGGGPAYRGHLFGYPLGAPAPGTGESEPRRGGGRVIGSCGTRWELLLSFLLYNGREQRLDGQMVFAFITSAWAVVTCLSLAGLFKCIFSS